MAGRPRSRARREARREALAQFPAPPKPLAEMTPDERAAYAASLRRVLRDDEVRRGSRRPKSMREVEIWREAFVDGDEQGQQPGG
jgi:hypothetical protein